MTPKKKAVKAPAAPRKPRRLVPKPPVAQKPKRPSRAKETLVAPVVYEPKPPVPAEPEIDLGHTRVESNGLHPWLRAIKNWF